MISFAAEFLSNTLALYLDAAPWLLLGLLAAGMIKAWVPDRTINKWVGGEGFRPVLRAALVGAPLPLCSCGTVPAALGLRRAGASPGATVSFLVATPETGIDSVALTYSLMGPFMAIARPVAAVATAITAGFFASRVNNMLLSSVPVEVATCASKCCGLSSAPAPSLVKRTRDGIRYAFTDLLRDIALWTAAGLALAGAVVTFVPPDLLASWGRGPLAYVVMLLVGIPIYMCATASTPLAAALLLAGASPGAVLVFLLAGPATNGATIAILRRELGNRLVAAYLAGIAFAAIIAGIATDAIIGLFGMDIRAQLATVGAEKGPDLITWASALSLVLLFFAPFTRKGNLSPG